MIRRRGASLDELEALYRSRFDVFARVAASVTGDAEQACDAVQEAFAVAVRKRGSFRREGPLEAWVWRIVLNVARTDMRRTAAEVDYDDRALSNGRPEENAELRAALAHLSEGDRDEGVEASALLRNALRQGDVAQALGRKEGTADQRHVVAVAQPDDRPRLLSQHLLEGLGGSGGGAGHAGNATPRADHHQPGRRAAESRRQPRVRVIICWVARV